MDGKVVQHQTNKTNIPTLPMKFGFVVRPYMDPTN